MKSPIDLNIVNIFLSSRHMEFILLFSVLSFLLHLRLFSGLVSQNPSAPAAESTQLPRDTDLSPGQPLQPGMSSSGVGVIGRRSVSDLGAIGDNLTGTSASSGHDQLYNMQMLEAAFHRLPQPKDSERAKTYIPVWVFEGHGYLLQSF